MKSIFVVCAVYLCLGESYGSDNTEGVGAFAYDGPSGRYGGTYGLKDGQVVDKQGTFPPDFTPPTYRDFDDFFPEYFSNLDNLLQETFIPSLPFFRPPPFHAFRRPKPYFRRTFDNVENQRLAYAAATKAFDLTSNRAGSNQFFAPSRSYPYGGNYPGFQGFREGPGYPGFQGQGFQGQGFQGQGFPGFDMSNYQGNMNRAFASASAGRGFTHQVAEIDPANPNNPNVNKFTASSGQPGGYKSVSSFSSSSSSSDSNGKTHNTRRAQTVVDDNGHITVYKVEN